MNTNLYVDVHILQDVPPANLNRDDTGSPKSARYGGVDRLRVSSQAWKRATRLDFQRHMPNEQLGIRTRRVQETVAQALTAGGIPTEQATPLAERLLSQINITARQGKSAESSYLLFFSRPQLQRLAAEVLENEPLWQDPDALKDAINVRNILGHGHSLDVALFGRMVADLAEINVDAAAQVSHALGTHAAPTQFDYFTAVDDAQGDDEAGAGMIGTVEFNSATLYRYATLNLPELISNMQSKAAAVAGVAQFLRSFTLSMPSGKQNTFAARTRPGLVWFVVRTDQPVNYVSAFERPVHADAHGYFAASVDRLAEFVAQEAGRWGDVPLAQAASYTPSAAILEQAFGPSAPFETAVETVRQALEGALANE
ncbi:MAG: type I-E CRISPR-associated protein Cas7/Cse4/CasC [Propionibacteriaceae bacterium]